MTNITWLVSLLCPRAVSPHPNFISTDLLTAPGALGLVVQNRSHEWDRLTSDRETEPLTEDEERLLVAARRAILGADEGNQADLKAIVRASGTDPGIAGAAALLGSVSLAENDAYDEVFELLTQASGCLSGASPEDLLFKAALRQQEAMRCIEVGEDYERARDEAQALLANVDVSQIAQFPTSKGAKWDSRTTVRAVRDLLIDANQDLFDLWTMFPNENELQRRLRREQSSILTASVQSTGSGSREFVDEQFGELTMSSEQIIGNRDDVDHPVWSSLMLFEFAGHYRQARAHRRLLGKLRLLRTDEDNNRVVAGSLRLLRQSGDLKGSKLALNYVRTQGPLGALRSETQHVLERRLSPKLLRDVELSVIEVGAQTVEASSAGEALSTLLESAEVPGPTKVTGGELRSIRVGQVLSASFALANASGRHSYFAEILLGKIRSIGEPDDELHARAYARGSAAIDWERVNDDVRSDWRYWLSEESTSGPWGLLVQSILPRLTLPSDERTVDFATFSFNLLANELNAVIEGVPPVEGLPDAAIKPTVDAIGRARQEASQGTFSLAGFDLADVAVGAALYLGVDIWEPVLGYLTDPNIPRSFKSRALDRMAASPEKVPEFARRELASGVRGLLAAQLEPMAFGEKPAGQFGAAIRLLGVIGIWNSEDLFAEVAKLGAGDSKERLEGARTAATLMRGLPEVPEWLLSAAISFSSDRIPNVRAESGQALAYALAKTDFAAELLTETVMGLLADDGTLVPLLVLRALSADPSGISGALQEEIERVSRDHIALVVRDQATRLLTALDALPESAADA